MTRFARVDLDAVAPLHPSNKTAAMVAGKGEHFAWKPPLSTKVHSDLPIPYRLPTADDLQMTKFVDLTGATVGRLRVMGMATEVSGKGTRWVVRCRCGAYETRRTKYLKTCIAGANISEDEPMCDWCGKTRKLQMGFGVVREGPLCKVEGYK